MDEAPSRIMVLSWFDVFPYDQAPTITCPDCDQTSPELRDPWATVLWVDAHTRTCLGGPVDVRPGSEVARSRKA